MKPQICPACDIVRILRQMVGDEAVDEHVRNAVIDLANIYFSMRSLSERIVFLCGSCKNILAIETEVYFGKTDCMVEDAYIVTDCYTFGLIYNCYPLLSLLTQLRAADVED